MPRAKKIGLIAGSGALPFEVVRGSKREGYDVFVAALSGFSRPKDFDAPARSFGLGEIGGLLKALRAQKCTDIVFAGYVSRPDFKKLKLDFYGMKFLPHAINAARKGDDGLLRYLVSIFEKEGFNIIAPQDLCAGLLVPKGYLGSVQSTEDQRGDIKKALEIATLIGAHDIGQAVIVCRGLVLAVEAQEGTDMMLRRTADLADALRGHSSKRAGVLLKCLKPNQESRVDLPTIGVQTVELAAKAGLAGIALAAGQAFIIDVDKVRVAADKLGLFIYGFTNNER